MSTKEDETTLFTKAAEEAQVSVREQIEAVAAAATVEERAIAEKILAEAKKGNFSATDYEITSGIAAVIFTTANVHNRDWRATKSVELARQIGAGEWEPNNASIGFYINGKLGDGQHRLGAIALSKGFASKVAIVYGMSLNAILTIDTGTRRSAADALKLEGIGSARKKEGTIKTAAAYLHRIGESDMDLRSNVETAAAMRNYDDPLTESIRIGDESLVGVVSPILKASQAYVVAFLCLYHEWPTEAVVGSLKRFQLGHAGEDGEKSPLFVAGEFIAAAREKAKGKDTIRRQGELGVVLKAMMLSVAGVKAVRSAELKAAAKTPPVPAYPGAMSVAA